MINIFHPLAATWFYGHALGTIFVIAVLFTAIGLFFGYLLWRHYQSQARRMLAINAKLRDKITVIEAHQKKLLSLTECQTTQTSASSSSQSH